jgi:hypothetical protein
MAYFITVGKLTVVGHFLHYRGLGREVQRIEVNGNEESIDHNSTLIVREWLSGKLALVYAPKIGRQYFGFYADSRGEKDKSPITVSGHSPKSSSIFSFLDQQEIDKVGMFV